MNEAIINKVAESGLLTLDLVQYYPEGDILLFDLKDYLFMGMILKEKDFRENLKTTDWEKFRSKSVGIVCSADAIIPPWAYMLVATYLQPIANEVMVGDEKEVFKTIFIKNLSGITAADYIDQRVVVKGCGDKQIDDFAYLEIAKILVPVAKTIMYGEPCSTVPIYKKRLH